MEGIIMALHSLLIGVIVYLFLHFALNYSSENAEHVSVFVAAICLVYMLLFGHALPKFLFA